MNLYQKMNEVRLLISNAEIKKSGYNKGLNFKYSELDDFMNHIIKFNKEHGLMSQFTLEQEKATLAIIDCDKPDDKLIFESPIAHAKLQGSASPIQELGSQMTYMRRYLYQIAYEITEGESLDGNIGKPVTDQPNESKGKPKTTATKQPDKPTPVRVITPNEAADLLSLCGQKGVPITKIMETYEVAELANLTFENFAKAVGRLEKTPDKVETPYKKV